MSKEQPEIKKIKRNGGILRFGFIFGVLLVFFISPLPSVLFKMIPEPWVRSALKDIYQSVTIDDAPSAMNDPVKYKPAHPLNVLGVDTGLCFTIASTLSAPDESKITTELLNDAQRGKTIANIIVISEEKIEYKLRKTSLDVVGENSIICQKFGNAYSIPPEVITTIYIQPLAPMAPSKIAWGTAKTIY